MAYTLILRLGRTSYCVQHTLSRVNVTLPPRTPAMRGPGPGLVGLSNGPVADWTRTRGFRVGVQFRSSVKDRGTNQASVAESKRSSGGSAAHKGLGAVHVFKKGQNAAEITSGFAPIVAVMAFCVCLTPAVKQAGTDFTYLVVVLVGLGVTGGLLYVIFQELFSSSSPSKLYGKAFDKCRTHPEVIGAFGEPIKGYGETTRRGRRQQVSHIEYLKDGQKHMRLKFYIEGSEPGLHGTVHSESKQNPETGKYEFRYIFVDIDTYPRRTIVVEDNR
uniref:Mitochondrial import inner membrane translocase subunit Tim21 n=1 Tax=Electrophorus electricus TaxID=8005 RepID=A0AAY5EF27_ELEEL